MASNIFQVILLVKSAYSFYSIFIINITKQGFQLCVYYAKFFGNVLMYVCIHCCYTTPKHILSLNLTCKVLLWRHAQVEKLSAVIRKVFFNDALYRTLLYLMPTCDTSMTRPMMMIIIIVIIIIIIQFVASMHKISILVWIQLLISSCQSKNRISATKIIIV